jgi:hypothetical protein
MNRTISDVGNVVEEYLGVVQSVCRGKHGPYAAATCEKFPGIYITFSLRLPVWKRKLFPAPGTQVILSDLQKKIQWRANKARLLTLADEVKFVEVNINEETETQPAVEQ